MTGPRPRAVVVGTTFGAVYAEALAAANSPVELVGLLATGSAASAQLADRLGVALYTDLDSLPPVDVAFVVVRAGVVGGEGTRLSGRLLARGIHVMQEQPVHAEEIISLLRIAKANSRLYAVNDFYSHVAPMRQFIFAAQCLDKIARVRYVHARSAIHVVFPLFTILSAIVGPLTPARIVVPQCGGSETAPSSFVAGRILLGDVTVDLLIQNELCASDPDNHARLMHAITVGSDAGELVLAHTHGSTRWHPRPHTQAGSQDLPITEPVGIEFEPTTAQVRNQLWPDAVRLAASNFVDSIDRRGVVVSQRFVRAVRLWSDFTSALGPATSIDPQPPLWVSASELVRR
ncbi:Gfo/Idh/MocA family oxidoreductase [Mycobacterium sp.]|uniref:Gfo/Idh/MocA family oxidoreductase n=1 Tax=Mycobacterium sp. TaxID=1785 RepID=UPI00128A99DF|nr:Gfo/Idh/MocA family oxidoreductase [Mycobacterium sp.]KAA8965441.1 MAG: thiazolinyl imide reductase [Mycobacterium sp.]